MIDLTTSNLPKRLKEIEQATKDLGFTMPSDRLTGSLLRSLCASKPAAQILEIGTGTGLSACWLLDGMDSASHLVSVDNDSSVVAVAKEFLKDSRLTLNTADGLPFIRGLKKASYDLIFADAMPGKYEGFIDTIQLLCDGGICVIDDMLPQDNWPAGHQDRVDELVNYISTCPLLTSVFLEWSTGVIICTKVQQRRV